MCKIKKSDHEIEIVFHLPLHLIRVSTSKVFVCKVEKSKHKIKVTFPIELGLLKVSIRD